MTRVSCSRRLVLSLAIALGLFLALELGLRVGGFVFPALEVPILIWNPDEDQLMNTRDYLFEPDAHSLWGLRPGARIQFGPGDEIGGDPEFVNEDGFRGPRIPRARTPGVIRIATMGDSSTFGVGVHYADTYSGQLQGLFEARGVRAEVLDAGVDGFTVRQGIERYRERVRRYRPDVVVAAFGAVNEHWGSFDMSDDVKIRRSIARSGPITTFVRFLRRNSRVAHFCSWLRNPDAAIEVRRRVFERRSHEMEVAQGNGRPDWPGERRVGLEEFKGIVRELKREVESDGARLILVVNPRRIGAEMEFPVLVDYTLAVLEVAAAEKLQVLDARQRFRVRIRAGDTEDRLFIHDFWHPASPGHRLIAEGLLPLVLDETKNVGRDEVIQALVAPAPGR